MTREEEKEYNSYLYENKYDGLEECYQPTLKEAYEAGWEAADKHPKNPWRDAKNNPPKDSKSVIGIDETGLVCHYEYSPEEGIWCVGKYISVAPDYWMPIPKTPRVS